MSKVEDSHIAVDTLAWLIEEAFEGDPDQSLLANLRDLQEDDWTALPPGAGRSIADIIEHVGWSKWMYDDYAFGSASLSGDHPPLIPADGARSRPHHELIAWLTEGHHRWLASVRHHELIAWLTEGHHRWLASVRALSKDSELERERLANWGDHLKTKVLIRIMIAHDLYHAGEINYLRALLHGTDRWPYE